MFTFSLLSPFFFFYSYFYCLTFPISSFFLYFFLCFLWPELVHPSPFDLSWSGSGSWLDVLWKDVQNIFGAKDSSCTSRNCLQTVSIEESQWYVARKDSSPKNQNVVIVYSCCFKTVLYAVFCPYGTQ